MKIIELYIDDIFDENQGLDGIALVESPAHQSGWIALSDEKYVILDDILNEDEQSVLAEMINDKGEDIDVLLKQGYKIKSVEKVKSLKQEFATTTVDGVRITSNPDKKSGQDALGSEKVRYKYIGPKDNKNRKFCAAMLRANKVFRIEDIQKMSEDCVNEQFGCYDIFSYRGSYNCRHFFAKIVFAFDEEIIKNGRVQPGSEVPMENLPTITRKTAEAQQARGQETSVTLSSIVDIIDGIPLFDNIEDALLMAEAMGCEGYHTHPYSDEDDIEVGYMPCSVHNFADYPWQECIDDQLSAGYTQEVSERICGKIKAINNSYQFQTYDYPQYIVDNAQRALRFIEEQGNPNDCLTPVGRRRVADLAQGTPVSLDILKRMKAYADRHKVDLESSKSFEEGCGLLAWYSWGLDETGRVEEWLEGKINSIEQEMSESNPDVSGLEPYVKQVSGITEQAVVNSKFSIDEEQRVITGAALIPEKLIIRRSAFGEVYWVYFSKDTVKKLAEKWMREKMIDKNINIEHTDEIAEDTYVVESWLVDDTFKDKSYALGMEFIPGTWVISMKVNSDRVWNEIRDGKYTGFSIEGWFSEKLIFNKTINN